MIDLHFHLLPGIDDGPATMEQTLLLAQAAAMAGARTIAATPHVNRRYANDSDTILPLVAQVGARLAAAGIAVELVPGAEVAATRIADLDASELERLTLGDGPWLLLEPPFATAAYGLEVIVLDLQRKGLRVLLAHPERCAAFHEDPRMLGELVRAGALISVTAGSLVGRFGGRVRRFASSLAREGMIHNVASDAHDRSRRPPGLLHEIRQGGMEAMSEWLTELVPKAILAGEEPPARPSHAIAPVARGAASRWPGRRRG